MKKLLQNTKKKKNYNQILCLVKIFFKNEGKIKSFSEKSKKIYH